MDGVSSPLNGVAQESDKPTGGGRRARVICRPPAVLLVGASTGGPQALTTLIASLAPIVDRLPVCVTLHMPNDLMPVIAAHVARTCRVATHVVTETRRLEVGVVHFSPGDRQFAFRRKDAASVELDLTPVAPRDLCKSAVDVMFTSAAACFGSRALAIVLSGMGKDGLAGAQAIVAAGGTVLVQDKDSSAVWGMPGAIVKANLAAAAMIPTAIASEVIRRVQAAAAAI